MVIDDGDACNVDRVWNWIACDLFSYSLVNLIVRLVVFDDGVLVSGRIVDSIPVDDDGDGCVVVVVWCCDDPPRRRRRDEPVNDDTRHYDVDDGHDHDDDRDVSDDGEPSCGDDDFDFVCAIDFDCHRCHCRCGYEKRSNDDDDDDHENVCDSECHCAVWHVEVDCIAFCGVASSVPAVVDRRMGQQDEDEWH